MSDYKIYNDYKQYPRLKINQELYVSGGIVQFDLGSDAQGDIYYRSSSGALTRLPIGTSGQVLTIDPATSLPKWIDSNAVITPAYEVRFKVGDTGVPGDGSSSFTLTDDNGNAITSRKVKLFIEGYKKYPTDDYTYNSSTGVITLVNPLILGQKVIIEAHASGLWTEINK